MFEDITSLSARLLDIKYEKDEEPYGDMKHDSNQHHNDLISDVVSKCEICAGQVHTAHQVNSVHEVHNCIRYIHRIEQ